MDLKVKEFIDAAKSKEREEFERQRDALLISLGLVKSEKERKFSKRRSAYFPQYDEETKQYFGEFIVAADVTDEEYQEIRRIAQKREQKSTDADMENGAESFLAVLNGIFLGIGIIAAIILLFVAIDCFNSYTTEDEGPIYLISSFVMLLVSFVSWAVTRVLLNISNNLHKINAKLK